MLEVATQSTSNPKLNPKPSKGAHKGTPFKGPPLRVQGFHPGFLHGRRGCGKKPSAEQSRTQPVKSRELVENKEIVASRE